MDLSPLKNADFRRLYLSQFISMLGTQMTMVTIPFQVYKITQSTLHTGLVSTIELVCLVATGLWGGVLADSVDRKRLLVAAECAMAIFVGVLAVNAALPTPSLVLIYSTAGILAALGGLHRPALEALTPLLVTEQDLPKVSVLASFKIIFASLVGPSLAGFLAASMGAALTYSIDLVSFVASLIFLIKIKTVIPSESLTSKEGSVVKQILDAALYLRSRKDILGSYIVDFCAMVFCMPHVLFPALAIEYGQEKMMGVLYAAVGAGSMVLSLTSGWTTKVHRIGLWIALSAGGWSLSIALAGSFRVFGVLTLGLFLAGACDSLSGIFRMTMWNESIPSQYRGRLASFSMLSYTSGPLLGNAAMGFMASMFGLQQSLLIGGCIAFGTVVLSSIALPEFYGYQRRGYTSQNNI